VVVRTGVEEGRGLEKMGWKMMMSFICSCRNKKIGKNSDYCESEWHEAK
jgi:hypothetical protein